MRLHTGPLVTPEAALLPWVMDQYSPAGEVFDGVAVWGILTKSVSITFISQGVTFPSYILSTNIAPLRINLPT